MKLFGWLLGIAALALVVFVVLGVTPLGRPMFQSMFETGEVAKIDFRQLSSIRSAARRLVCPGFDMCAQSDDRTPVYDNSVAQVKATWEKMLREREPNMRLVLADDADHQYTYVVRSGFFQMPDLVTIQIFPQGEARASVAIYSRSVYAAGDFGSNSRRVIRMMDYMDENLSIFRR